MKRLRIGVIGCANIAQRLMIPAIQTMKEQWELVGIASRTKEKADSFAQMFGCEGIVGYNSLLARKDINAIYMPLPTGLHKEWIIKALQAGKHVYAEKSIAMNANDAQEMVDLAKEKGLALMEGYMFQYHQQHQKVKDLIAKGEIGEIRNIRASFGFPPFPDSNNFRYDNVIGGGALKDAAGYVWRAINFICGNYFELKAANVHYDKNGTSLYGSAFATNGNISAEISFGFENYYQCNYEIWGSKGKISCLRAYTPKPNETTKIIFEQQGVIKEISCEPYNHFVGAMNEFYCLCTNQGDKQKHYEDILFQAKGLDEIETLSRLG